MTRALLRFCGGSLITFALLNLHLPALAQIQQPPELGPRLKPLVKLVGFLNAPRPQHNAHPVLTVKLPYDDKQYTFLLTDLRIMAGPVLTPGDILSEVTPYTPNFYIRTAREVATQIASAGPTDRLSILAEYWAANRALSIQSFEKSPAE